MKLDKSRSQPDFPVYFKGADTRLIIQSGTHGDEFGIIALVKEALDTYEAMLPDFIFIPQVSPSAVKRKTRLNQRGVDLNRVFYSESIEPEVQMNIKVMEGLKTDLLVSFHEDINNEEYYIYDSGYTQKENGLIKKHNQFLKKQGLKLLNGLDDPEDPTLGYKFIEGYIKHRQQDYEAEVGWINEWALCRRVTLQTWIPEIPGKLELKMKQVIVNSFFEQVLLPHFTKGKES